MFNTNKIFQPPSTIDNSVYNTSDEEKEIDKQILDYCKTLGMSDDVAKLFVSIAAVNTNNYTNDMWTKDNNPYGVIWLGTNGTKGTSVPGMPGNFFVKIENVNAALLRAWNYCKANLQPADLNNLEKIFSMFTANTSSLQSYVDVYDKRNKETDWIMWGLIISSVAYVMYKQGRS